MARVPSITFGFRSFQIPKHIFRIISLPSKTLTIQIYDEATVNPYTGVVEKELAIDRSDRMALELDLRALEISGWKLNRENDCLSYESTQTQGELIEYFSL